MHRVLPRTYTEWFDVFFVALINWISIICSGIPIQYDFQFSIPGTMKESKGRERERERSKENGRETNSTCFLI